MLTKTYNRENYELLVLYHIGQLENSIHFIFDKKSKECALLDPAWEADLFLDIIKEKGYTLTQIWLTHWHPDHTNATDELVSKTGATVKIGVNELDFLQVESELELLPDNAEFTFGGTKVKIIEAGGHSFGGICYILSDDIFVGDTLFVYGAGHCALPKANPEQFFYSMQKIKQLVPENVYLRCGHNYGTQLTTTISEQKLHNPFLLIDDLNDFVTYRQEIHDRTRTYPMDKVTKEELREMLS